MESNLKPQELSHCSACPLSNEVHNKTQYIPVTLNYKDVDEQGKPIIDVLVLGENPGKQDDEQGIGFTGDASREVKNALHNANITGYALTTVLKCRPFDTSTGNNRAPTQEELTCCRHYLEDNIKKLNPKVIVLVGNSAVKHLLPNPDWKDKDINKIHGEYYKDSNDIIWIPTFHPTRYLKSASYKEQQNFRNTFKKIPRIISGAQDKYAAKGYSTLLTTLAEVKEFVDYIFSLDTKEMDTIPGIAIDTETENLNRVARNGLATIQFAIDNDTGIVIPVDHPDSPFKGEDLENLLVILRNLFTSNDPKFSYWIAHHSKFDRDKIVRRLGITKITKPIICTEFLEYLIDENLRDSDNRSTDFTKINLKEVAKNRLSFIHYDKEVLEVRGEYKGIWNLPLFEQNGSTSKLVDYSGMDAYVDRRLCCAQFEELRSQKYRGSIRFATRWESRVSHLITKMENNGILVDKEHLAYLAGPNSPIITQIAKIPIQIKESPEGKKANSLILKNSSKTKGMKPLFGKEPWIFDINTKDHKVALLVDACELEPVEIDKEGKPIVGKDGRISIAKRFYEKHEGHPIADMVQDYFGLEKLRTSYLNSIQEFFGEEDNKEDGKIHSTFHITSTVSGRASSSDPNLQQCPRTDTPEKAMIKSMYGADINHIILEIDYSQAEVRWWAQIAGDEEFAKLFVEMGKKRAEYDRNPTPELKKEVELTCDIHRQVAALMHQIKIENVTKAQRQGAKSLCVAEGTFVRTSRGLERIEDVVNNWDGLVDIEARNGREKATACYKFNVDKTIKITTNRGYELGGRPEHPILIWRDCKLQLVELQDLNSEDRVIIRKGAKFFGSPIDLIPYIWERTPGKTGKTPFVCEFPKTLTKDLARLIGYIVAEGSSTYNGIIYIWNNDINILNDIKNILESHFGKNNSWAISYPEKGNLGKVSLYKRISEFLRLNELDIFGRKSTTKQIPKPILMGSKEIITEYLRGYFAGDGFYNKREVKVTTSSRELAKQTQLLLLEIGIISSKSYYYIETNKGSGWYYDIRIEGVTSDLFRKECPPVRSYRIAHKKSKYMSSNIDHIYGLQTICKKYREDNNKKGSYHKYPPISWAGTKEISIDFIRKHWKEFTTGLKARGEKQLVEDIKTIIDNNYFLDGIKNTEINTNKNQAVYDFTVLDSHTFVTQGFISQNTFGAMFGQHYKTLAKILKISDDKAEELQNLFLQQFRKAFSWLTDIENFAEKHHYVDSPYGRRRHLEAEFMRNPGGAKRKARNSPIQSASSDTMFLCASRFQDWIEENNLPLKIVNAVHDAMLIQIPLDYDLIKLTIQNAARCMTDLDSFLLQEFGIKMIVPFEVEMKAGLRWGNCKVIDEHNLELAFLRWEKQNELLSKGKKWNEISISDIDIKVTCCNIKKSEEEMERTVIATIRSCYDSLPNLLEEGHKNRSIGAHIEIKKDKMSFEISLPYLCINFDEIKDVVADLKSIFNVGCGELWGKVEDFKVSY